jgi:hypothetical protein
VRKQKKGSYVELTPAEVRRARPVLKRINPALARDYQLKVSADGRIMSIPEEFCPPLKKKTGR